MLELRLFGTGQAYYQNKALPGFPNQQASLLLCYLLLNPHSHHRERLAAVFWNEAPVHVSRKHLSQALWRLRHTLQAVDAPVDEYLLIDKERIAFNVESGYWLDVEAFETIVTRYQDIPGHKLTPEQGDELDYAVSLYGGDLLDSLYEDWCLFNRERLSLLHLEALAKLMVFHQNNQTYEQGLACGEKILTCDNSRERVHQQMMRLYWLAGRRNAALSQFKQCTQILQDELGVSPMPETRQLYEQMLNNQFQPHNHPGETALTPVVRSEESLRQFADQSLRQVTHLQTVIAETSAELRQLERLIRKTLLDS